MRTFDATLPSGQKVTFEVTFSIALFRRIKGLLGFDLLSPSQAVSVGDQRPTIQVVLQDLAAFVDVAWVAVEKQAQALGLADVEFGELLDDATFLACRKAVLEEWEDFFARAGVTAEAATLRKCREMFALAGGKIDEIPTTSLMGPVDRELKSFIAGLTSTSSPASSGSTPSL